MRARSGTIIEFFRTTLMHETKSIFYSEFHTAWKRPLFRANNNGNMNSDRKYGLPTSLIGFKNMALTKLRNNSIRGSLGSKNYNTCWGYEQAKL